ncbi:MAG: energy transducer TonB [Prevotellaceae bacterium]|jgi:protein TonB|nr:energy transducer TonB [Prevotellaceae bacterium]
MTEKKQKYFLAQPAYPGGNRALNEFVAKNLHYPEQAVQNNISGSVHLQYVVNDDGIVESVKVLKGLGYGCDEEAVRIVKLFKFGKVKNRGIRLKTTKKIRINFNKIIRSQELIYSLKRQNDEPAKINYTITYKI